MFDISQAVRLHQSRQPREAEAAYRRILADNPTHGDALHLIGTLYGELGRPEQGMALIKRAVAARQHAGYYINFCAIFRAHGGSANAQAVHRAAIALRPDHLEGYYSLASSLGARGRLAEAERAWRRALALKFDQPESYFNLGGLLRRQGRLAAAKAAYVRALTLRPDDPRAHFSLAALLQDKGRLEAAESACLRALALKPDHLEALANLAGAYQARGRREEAETACRKAIALKPDHPHAHFNLGVALHARSQPEAETVYVRALRLRPGYPEALANLSGAYQTRGRFQAAEAAYRQVIALKPDHPEAHFNLGVALHARSQPEAQAAYVRALTLRPNYPEALANLGGGYFEDGQFEAAEATYRKLVALKPDDLEILSHLASALLQQGRVAETMELFRKGGDPYPSHSLSHRHFLLALHYTSATPDAIYKAHLAWGERHANPLTPSNPRFANPRDPNRVLRVGYVSPDFNVHSCARFSEPLLKRHDRTRFEIFCYPTSGLQDQITDRFRALAQGWRPLVGLDDDRAVEAIGHDGIDILVDLAGHTGENRLMVFARKAAPVRVTWLGYPDTTGMAAMDYRLTDAIADPVGVADTLAVERLVRLPGGFVAFQPEIGAAPAQAPPHAMAGHFTFGSFNNTPKVTAKVIAVWAEILARVPGSRLIVKSRALTGPSTRRRYAELLQAAGIAPERFDLLAWIEPMENHLGAYDHIDIALDTFPYNGTTTTCEALWMGVPVVTLAGGHHVARVGASLLTRCGLEELIADDEADYVAKAVALAGDSARLAILRAGMRARLEASPLTDHAGFARNVETAYRRMWRDWLEMKTR